MRTLITGGSGFIGRVLVQALLESGHEVTVLDRRGPIGTEASSTMAKLPVRWVVADIRDNAAVEEALDQGTEAVFHLAAVTSVLKSKEDPVETFETNVAATFALLERSRNVGLAKFIMASTNAVAGDIGRARINEQTVPTPLTPYGATKAAAEMLMSSYTSSYGMACSAIRLTNVYGPGMKEKDSFVPRLMRAAMSGDAVAIYGDGEQQRDFVYVDDAVSGLLLPIDENITGPLTIGFGRSFSVNELHREVCSATGVDIPVRHEEPKVGEMRVVSVETARAASFGFVPKTGLPEGLIRTWEDMRSAAEE